jgi:hypothetical protein
VANAGWPEPWASVSGMMPSLKERDRPMTKDPVVVRYVRNVPKSAAPPTPAPFKAGCRVVFGSKSTVDGFNGTAPILRQKAMDVVDRRAVMNRSYASLTVVDEDLLLMVETEMILSASGGLGPVMTL